MSRLTMKSKRGEFYIPRRYEDGYGNNVVLSNEDCINKLGHYEDLEEQGRLIELPCAVGDTVYTIGRHCPRPWKKEYCDDARKILQEDSCGVCPHRTAYIATHEFDFDDLTYESEIFTTKEEAEAKLAEMEGVE